MKKKFILTTLVGAILYLTLSSYYYGPASSLGNLTGATGTTAACGGGGCHGSGATSSTGVTVQLLSGSTPVTCYVPGTTYTLKISGSNGGSTTLPNFGFQMCVVKTSGAGSGSAVNAGTMSSPPSSTHIQTVSGIQVFEHYNASFGDGSLPATTGGGAPGGTYVTTISWTAPAAGTGSVVIYGVLNAVNHNFSADGGDLWNFATPVTIGESGSGTVSGTLALCPGATTTLSAGTGGTWSSSVPAVATINAGTGLVNAVSAGTTTINYTTTCGLATAVLTVNPLPAAISGIGTVCSGATTTLSNTTPGGTWTSISPSVATVTSPGSTTTVTGVSTGGGTSLISYTLPTSCAATTTVTVNPAPPAISGVTTLCQGATTTLSSGTGGTWSSSVTTVATIGASSGLLTAVATGTVPLTTVITYTSPAGCSVSATVTVNPLPSAISGAGSVCPGSSITLTDAGSGTWSSGSTGIAAVGAGTGIVTGVAPAGGTSVITYTLPGGCTATKTITVNPAPGSISGSLEICPGSTTTLTDAGGGTWATGSPGVASVGSSSGVVAGIATSGGSAVITYTLPVTGCNTTATVVVDAAPPAISGTLGVCQGGTTALSDIGGGTWASSATAIATVDGTGLVSGVAAGTANITYTLPGTGCTTVSVVTVNGLPAVAPITGTLNVCAGATTNLSDISPGGTWISGSAGIAGIGTTGVVTGITAGTSIISYSVTNGAGCTAISTAVVTVNALPAGISGTNHVCTGATITLTETGSGTWASSTPGIASATTPGATSTIGGVAAGTAVITFTLPATGCFTTTTISVNQNPAAISGPAAVCIGSGITLTDTPPGGTWSSSNANATAGAGTGLVTGVSAGTSVITYGFATGCFATKTITVNALPVAISGPAQVCIGANITLTDAGGGTWSSSNANATVGAGTGIVTGAAAGTSVITYTLGTGCFRTTTITINALPSAISGPATVCVGQSATLTDATGGGTWATGSTAIETVGAATGIVTGITFGTNLITYTAPLTGCAITFPMTVNALTPISGLTSMCTGSSTTLTDGATGGTWTSSLTSVATIGSSSGLVTAVGPGSTVITYTTPAGCVATTTLNVISSPSSISGPTNVCVGSPVTLTDAGGGTWASSNTAVAGIGSATGLLTPVATGTTTVTYSLGTGCTVSATVTVNPALTAISGPSAVCVGNTIVLTDAITGGTWSSNNANVSFTGTTGAITGVTAGTSVISYTNAAGCFVTRAVTINALPVAIAGAGTLSACIGAPLTLTDGTTGGTWSMTPAATGTIGAVTGVANGIAAGVATASYTISATGCTTTAPVTINAVPAAITGTAAVCTGATTTLADGGTGTWASSNANATVDATGLVTGVTAGTSVISYSFATGCFALRTVTVNPLPLAITGAGSVCAGSSITLTDGSTGGSWSSASPAFATVGSGTGVVTGIAGGTAAISFTITATGCARTAVVTVNPTPSVISGITGICVGGTATLTGAGSGTWSSSAPAIAAIGSATGILTGVSTGTAVISYALSGCARTITVTVHPLPAAITGPDSVCAGATATLTDAGGGTWASGNTAIATIGSSTGVVSGVAAGTAAITYTLGTGCAVSVTVSVRAAPAPVTGTATVCASSTIVLSDATGGGTWHSAATGTATIDATGTVTGVAAGTAVISYTIISGCVATAVVTVNPLPLAITGATSLCPLATITLTDAGGGTWISSATGIATIGSATGTVTGIAAGTTTITYTLGTGCMTAETITVDPLPFAGSITGASSLCADSSVVLSDTVSGGTWSSFNTSLATVGTSGITAGVSAGVDTIYYAVTNSCGTATAAHVVTVNPLPVAGVVSGPTFICSGVPATLTNAATGGTWSSSNTAAATIDAATGVVTTVAAGFTTFTYSVTNGCGTATAHISDTVAALPSGGTILGADSVCVGDTIHLGDVVTGGVWSTVTGNASVGATGIVTGVAAGTDTVRYTVTTACGSATARLLVNVRSHAACNVAVQQVAAGAAAVRVYPNPSGGTFTIELPATTGNTSIMVTDMLGKVIAEKTVTDAAAQKVVFNLYNVAAGSYLLKVNTGTTTYRDKIVIW